MNQEEVIETLHTALQQKLVASFGKLTGEYNEYYSRFIRSLSVLQQGNKGEGRKEVFRHLFDDITEYLNRQQVLTFTRAYIEGIDTVLVELPEVVTWEDEIQLRQEVKYHLAAPAVIADLLRDFKQQQLPFFMRLEKELAPHLRHEEDHSSIDYASLIELLEKQKSYIEESFKQKLEDRIGTIYADITNKIEKKITGRRIKIKSQKADKQWTLCKNELQKIEKQWHEPQVLLFERSENILAFIHLQRELKERRTAFLQHLARQFEEAIARPLQQFRNELQEATADIKEGPVQDSAQIIADRKSQLLSYASRHLEAPFQRLQKNRFFSQQVEQYSEDVLMQVNEVPEEMSFIFSLPTKQQPTSEDLTQIEWRVLLVRIFREQVLNEIKPEKQEYDHFISPIIQAVEEIRDILDVNLGAAVLNGDSGEESPQQVAAEALERVIKRVGHLTLVLQNEYDSIETLIKDRERTFVESAVTCFNAKSAKELHMFMAKYKVKETTKDWQDLVDSKAEESKNKLLLWHRFLRRKAISYAEEVKHFFGYGDVAVPEAKRADIISYLSETDQKIKELPYIYRQIFDFDHVVDQRFYVPVVESTATFNRAYEQWDATAASVAVVGEKGSGKSTFLELMASELPGKVPSTKVTVEQTIWTEEALCRLLSTGLELDEAYTTMDEIIEALTNGKPRVVILESIQNCFVRNINGYKAIEKLCSLFAETRETVFWVVSCSRYGWHFLDEVQSLSEYFTHIIRPDTLDAEDLEKMIMSRHRSSGYMLQFDENPDATQKRSSKKMTDKELQQNLREEYFKELTAFADGNASIAIIFWIRSIRTFDDQCIYIKPLEITSVEIIAELSAEVLFVLAVFVIHDTISDKDLSMILNLSRQESRLILKRLSARGLLLEKGDDYMINHLVYRQVVRVLKERNIIHLVE